MPFTPGRPVTEASAELFKAMAHPARVRILEILSDRDHTVGELVAVTGLEPSHLSQQLGILRRRGLVDSQRVKSSVVCTLSDPKIVHLLAITRELLTTHVETSKALSDALNDEAPSTRPAR